MKNQLIITKIPLFLATVILVGGCSPDTSILTPGKELQPSETQVSSTVSTENVVTGKVTGISQKAMTVTVETPTGQVLIKFDGDTNGLRHLEEDAAVIINYKPIGRDKIATDIQPKFAKLPPGVADILPDELAELVAKGPEKGNYLLIDARPAGGYAKGHIPTALSIPVDTLKEGGKSLLPLDNKDKLLIFYCGGPT